MRVVSLRRLDENKGPSPRKRSIFYLVPRMVLLGIVIALTIVALSLYKTKTFAKTKQPAPAHFATLSASTGNMIPQQLLPEGGDTSDFLADQFLATIPPPTLDCQKTACVALTFDDGPNADSTSILLNTLERHRVHASFFEIGNKVKGNESQLIRMRYDGDDIGNHSWSHASFLKLTPIQIHQQVQQTQDAIVAAGVPAPYLFRPPYGDFLLKMQKDINLSVILWNVDPKDWSYKDPIKISTVIEQQIKPGAIIVMHDRVATAQAIDKVLTDLKGKYNFVTVSELLNLKPDSQGVYIGR